MRVAFTIPNRALALAALCGACFATGSVLATAFPSPSEAMYYSGLLTDDAGNPRVTTSNIEVELFDVATGGTALCGSASTPTHLGASAGRFRVALPAACAEAIGDHGDVYAQVSVDGTELPRQKLGVTAFAAVARDALSADFAAEAATVADGAVTEQKLAAGAVGSDKLAPEVTATLDELTSRMLELERAFYSPIVGEAGGAYSANAIYRGKTAPSAGNFAATRNGAPLTGYAAAKYLCEIAVGSPLGHICTSEDAARSAQVGIVPIGAGWIASGASFPSTASVGAGNECAGFTSGSAANAGTFWNVNGNPEIANCNNAFAIHCCY